MFETLDGGYRLAGWGREGRNKSILYSSVYRKRLTKKLIKAIQEGATRTRIYSAIRSKSPSPKRCVKGRNKLLFPSDVASNSPIAQLLSVFLSQQPLEVEVRKVNRGLLLLVLLVFSFGPSPSTQTNKSGSQLSNSSSSDTGKKKREEATQLKGFHRSLTSLV